MIVVHVLTLLLFVYLLLTIPYLFLLAMAGRFGRLKQWSRHPVKANIDVIIPSYKGDSVILDTGARALRQDYPRYQVTVIADQLQPQTIAKLKSMPLDLLEVHWEKSMKAKSLNAALSRFTPGHYDLALILDADNLMSDGCLEKI